MGYVMWYIVSGYVMQVSTYYKELLSLVHHLFLSHSQWFQCKYLMEYCCNTTRSNTLGKRALGGGIHWYHLCLNKKRFLLSDICVFRSCSDISKAAGFSIPAYILFISFHSSKFSLEIFLEFIAFKNAYSSCRGYLTIVRGFRCVTHCLVPN